MGAGDGVGAGTAGQRTVSALRDAGGAAGELERTDGLLVLTDGGCEVWTGAMTGAGMPSLRYGGRSVGLPRLVWTLLHGPLPPGRSSSVDAASGAVSRRRTCGWPSVARRPGR